ncbi:MAG: hypothetical protein ACOCP8_06035 [archaeon]
MGIQKPAKEIGIPSELGVGFNLEQSLSNIIDFMFKNISLIDGNFFDGGSSSWSGEESSNVLYDGGRF